MRLRALGPVALLACSSSHEAAHDAGVDSAPQPATCDPGALVLSGSSNRTPHGTYATTNVEFGSGAFSASLPASGTVALTWNGDPTSGPVALVGTLTIPPDDGGPLAVWCVDVPSTIHVEGGRGVLDLALQPEPAITCSPVGAPDGVKTTPATGCFVPPS